MSLHQETLEDACKILAKAMLWKAGDSSHDIVDTVGTQIYEEAERHVAYVELMGSDPRIVTRAVLYITHVHGLPIGADVARIAIILETLIELAVPNTGMTSASAAFLADVRNGIDDSLRDVSES